MRCGAAVAVFVASLALFSGVSVYAAHDMRKVAGKVRCTECHAGLPFDPAHVAFVEGTKEVCLRCHRAYHGSAGFSHPIEKLPSMAVPRDMPLDPQGRISCITCHVFHDSDGENDKRRAPLLRRTKGKALCYSCHKQRLF